MTEEQVFLTALEFADSAARIEYLDRVCGRDAELRRQVDSLLAAHFKSGEFLDQPLINFRKAGETELVSASAESAEPVHDNTIEHPHSGDEAVITEQKPDEASDDLHFLHPSIPPDSLGRIGHYEVLEVLGRGGFGIVLRAFDPMLQRVVALKVLAPAIAATSPARKRFLREAVASAKVRHEHVVQIYAVQEQPLPYLVMEFIPGESLQQRLDRTGPLDLPEILRIARQIAEGLAAAHETGLIHRDIKPGNILIEKVTHANAKITDFGLARAADDASTTQSGAVAGTPMYMAPEQARGDRLDHRADLFSLGSVMYVMASGRPPFRAATTFGVLKRVVEEVPRPIQDIIPEVPQWLCDIITRLQAKKPEDRFQTAREVANLLADCEAKIKAQRDFIPPAAFAQPAGPATQPRSTPSPSRRGTRWLLAAAIVMLPWIGLALTEFFGVTQLSQQFLQRQDSPLEDSRVVDAAAKDPKKTPEEKKDSPEAKKKTAVNPILPASLEGVWAKTVAALGVVEQVEEVRKELMRRNPNFDGTIRHSIVDDVVTELGVPLDNVTDISPIRVFGGLRVLDCGLMQPDVTFSKAFPDLTALKGMNLSQLQDLNLRWTTVGDADLAFFKDCKNLRILRLNNTKVGDAGLAHFKDCKDLELVELFQTRLTNAGLASLQGCTKLKVVHLGFATVGNAGLAHLKDCKALTDLELRFTQVTDAGLTVLKNFEDLAYLNLTATKVSDAGMAHVKHCQKLKSIALDVTGVTDAGLVHLKECKNLEDLVVPCQPITDAGLAHLKEYKKLTSVNLSETKVGDAGLVHLAECKKLTYVKLHKTKVTAEGIDKLKRALPLCKIEWDGGVVEPFTDADVSRISALPAVEQVEEVRKELKKLNPGFDGTLTPTIKDGVVAELKIVVEHVDNIAPLRAFKGLVSLDCDPGPPKGSRRPGMRGKLSDISPLQGLRLTHLNLSTANVESIEVVKELPIWQLSLDRVPVADLSPLAGKVLNSLHIGGSKVKSLADVPAARVEALHCYPQQLSDPAELQRLGVRFLFLWNVPRTIDPEQIRVLRPRLVKINGKSVDDFLREIAEAQAPKTP